MEGSEAHTPMLPIDRLKLRIAKEEERLDKLRKFKAQRDALQQTVKDALATASNDMPDGAAEITLSQDAQTLIDVIHAKLVEGSHERGTSVAEDGDSAKDVSKSKRRRMKKKKGKEQAAVHQEKDNLVKSGEQVKDERAKKMLFDALEVFQLTPGGSVTARSDEIPGELPPAWLVEEEPSKENIDRGGCADAPLVFTVDDGCPEYEDDFEE